MQFLRGIVDVAKKWFWVFMDQLIEWTGWAVNSTFGWYTGKPIDPVIASWMVWGGIIGISVGSILLWKFFGATLDD